MTRRTPSVTSSPLGRALAPGQTLVVFGGGVPVGRFGGAEVQWATAGLSLTKEGDVITLRDGANAIVRQFSWGDCDGSPCAKRSLAGTARRSADRLVLPAEPRRRVEPAPLTAGFRYSARCRRRRRDTVKSSEAIPAGLVHGDGPVAGEPGPAGL